MKMAKATEADLEMANDLSRIIENIEAGHCPTQAMKDPESEDIEWLHSDDSNQMQRLINAIRETSRRGSIFRVTFGMSVVCDPVNELLDPDSDVLEIHPKLKKNANRYQFLRDKFAIKAINDEDEFAKLAHLTGDQFDAAIDAAMTATEES